MPLTRRDLVLSFGGGAAGLALSPVPWRLIDDVALWSQHRHSIPVPRSGEVTWKSSACTICPGGCALRVRCVDGRAIFATGEARHPLAGGACAVGLTAHQLALHRLRLRQPMRRVGADRFEPVSTDLATAVVLEALADARRRGMAVAVLDQRPGRALSRTYREWMAAVPGGIYVTCAGEGATLEALAAMCGSPMPLGIDLERTATLLAFGAGVLEAWGQSGRMAARRGSLRVVAVDAWASPTASMADEWVLVRPGTEGVLALGLAHVLLRDGADGAALAGATRTKLERFAPRPVEEITGVEARLVEALARSLVASRPVVAIGGGHAAGGPMRLADEQAIALLNVVLGSVGEPGGIRPRRAVPGADASALPDASGLQAVPNAALRVLLLDAADGGRALPWSLLEPRLSPDALVVSLSPFRSGLAARAHVLLPAPAPLEAFDEVLPTPDAVVASFGLAAPILPVVEGTTDPAELVGRLAEAAGAPLASPRSQTDLLKQRVAAIAEARRGRMVVRTEKGFEEAAPGSAEEMWTQLAAGGRWVDDPIPHDAKQMVALVTPPCLPTGEKPAQREGAELTLLPLGARGVVGGTPLAAVLSKLYQESGLRPAVGVAALNPATARGLGLAEKSEVRFESGTGASRARVRLDVGVPLGCVAMAAGPDPLVLHPTSGRSDGGALALVEPDAEGVWNQTRVRIRKV